VVSWTQKYAPQKRSEVVGNSTSVNSIIGYLNRFRNINLQTSKTKNALLLYGPPGIGKTSSVLAIANALNFDVVIVNASDKRNKTSLRAVRNASQFSSLEETLNDKIIGQLLLIDEVDGLSGTADRGGVREIVEIIKSTRVPIILTANEITAQKFKSLKDQCELSRFEPPTPKEVLKILRRIVEAEKLTVSNDLLLKIIEMSDNDIRGSINSLQTLGSGRDNLEDVDLSILAKRDQSVDIRDFLKTIFIEKDGVKANNQTRLISDVDYNKLLLILRDVTARIIGYDEHDTIAKAYSLLAQADISLARALRKRIWSQLFYFYFHLTRGLASVVPDIDYLPPFQDWQLQVPQFWITLSRQRRGKNIALKVGRKCSVSSTVAINSIFPFLRVIFNNDAEMASDLAIEFGLFDVEPGKRKTRIIWNKEIDYFSKDRTVNRKIKSLIRKKYESLDRIQMSEVDAEVLRSAQEYSETLRKSHKISDSLNQKKKSKKKKPKKKPSSSKKREGVKQKQEEITQKGKSKVEKKRKKSKTSKTLSDFF
jgi:replication factor C large subunit